MYTPHVILILADEDLKHQKIFQAMPIRIGESPVTESYPGEYGIF